MKKSLLVVLAVAFALSLAACGAKSTSDKAPSNAEQVKNAG
jgi:predicted small lipoprotein YifL